MDGLSYSVEPLSSTLRYTISKGRHEQPERDLVRRWLPSDAPVVEFGGGMGVVSCLTNRNLNDCRFNVVNKALGYGQETITLDVDPDFVGSSAFRLPSNAGQVSVPT